jgi:hypothetical protein
MKRPAVLLALWGACDGSAVTVKTPLGAVTGQRFDGFDQFLGLPFVKQPGRFRVAEDLVAFPTDPFVAFGFGDSCPQWPGQLFNASAFSEDCLSLNVFRPVEQRASAFPVMLFIHGGGFTQGGSSEFNASLLAAKFSVVVVTANYRCHSQLRSAVRTQRHLASAIESAMEAEVWLFLLMWAMHFFRGALRSLRAAGSARLASWRWRSWRTSPTAAWATSA